MVWERGGWVRDPVRNVCPVPARLQQGRASAAPSTQAPAAPAHASPGPRVRECWAHLHWLWRWVEVVPGPAPLLNRTLTSATRGVGRVRSLCVRSAEYGTDSFFFFERRNGLVCVSVSLVLSEPPVGRSRAWSPVQTEMGLGLLANRRHAFFFSLNDREV